MTEKDLIIKIRQLRQIKPRKDWVVLSKSQILGEEVLGREKMSFSDILKVMFFQPKIAFASSLIVLGLLMSSLSFAYGSLPGDLLYPVKRAMEKSQGLFVSKQEKPRADLQLANKRLQELTQIAENNQTPKLAPAINEFQKSATEAAKNLREPKKITKEVVRETKKLLENKEKLETLGVVIGDTKELDNNISALIQNQITDLEKRSLTEGQKATLEIAKQSLALGDLNKALEKVLEINPDLLNSEINLETSPETNLGIDSGTSSEVIPVSPEMNSQTSTEATSE